MKKKIDGGRLYKSNFWLQTKTHSLKGEENCESKLGNFEVHKMGPDPSSLVFTPQAAC